MSKTLLPDSLVSTEWLSQNLANRRLRVVDIRGYVRTTDLGGGKQAAEYLGARDEYEAGHIPGAVYVDWTTDIVDPDSTVKAQIAPPDIFAAAMSERGIGDDTDVVIVDHTGGNFATRLWWALKYYGHDRAAVLDGGFNKWTAEGRATDQVSAGYPRETFSARVRPGLRAEAGEVLALATGNSGLLVDARDAGQYTGEIARGSRGGHIPTAVHIPAKSLINADGTWKSIEEQRVILAQGGVTANEHVVAYCNGGVTATAVLFALDRIGHRNYANYDGSWNEWGERLDLPVEVQVP